MTNACLGFAGEWLEPDLRQIWQEVSDCLEGQKRRLLDCQQGSVVFSLLCPTAESVEELRSEAWRERLTSGLEKLLEILGEDATAVSLSFSLLRS